MNSRISQNWLNAWSIAVIPAGIGAICVLLTELGVDLPQESRLILKWSIPIAFVASILYLLKGKAASRNVQWRIAQGIINGALMIYGILIMVALFLLARSLTDF